MYPSLSIELLDTKRRSFNTRNKGRNGWESRYFLEALETNNVELLPRLTGKVKC